MKTTFKYIAICFIAADFASSVHAKEYLPEKRE
ncbi:hypothetical protein SAMN05428947_101318 [Mucilaginibacter sp. OK283]|nr:hypothetical protein SAMN05428947_101318 [Mucilaginibacter sp. OK283]